MPVSSEEVQRTVETVRKAAELNRATAARRGNVVELGPDDADDLMITADLHGHRVNFDSILRVADLDNQQRRHLVMQEVCHGGPFYPSGTGCMSHLLLEDVAALKVKYPERMHFLLSNHELAELTDFPITKANRMLNLSFRCGLQELYGDATDEVRDAYLAFIGSCPIAVRMHNIFVCHSAPENSDLDPIDREILQRPLVAQDMNPQGDLFRLVWGRDFRPENAAAFASQMGADVLIHGHEPCDAGFHAPNEHQVILDCCAQRACYAVLPADGPLDQAAVLDLIRYL